MSCPFNSLHRIKQPDLPHHLANCVAAESYLLQQIEQREVEVQQQRLQQQQHQRQQQQQQQQHQQHQQQQQRLHDPGYCGSDHEDI